MRVRCPHIHLRIEPTRIIEARRSDRDKLSVRVGLDHNRRAAFRAKAATGHATATRLTRQGMEPAEGHEPRLVNWASPVKAPRLRPQQRYRLRQPRGPG
jgi:hypothetical protein